MHKRERPLKIFVHNSLAEVIRNFIHQSYLFQEKLGFKIYFEEFDKSTLREEPLNIRLCKDILELGKEYKSEYFT